MLSVNLASKAQGGFGEFDTVTQTQDLLYLINYLIKLMHIEKMPSYRYEKLFACFLEVTTEKFFLL